MKIESKIPKRGWKRYLTNAPRAMIATASIAVLVAVGVGFAPHFVRAQAGQVFTFLPFLASPSIADLSANSQEWQALQGNGNETTDGPTNGGGDDDNSDGSGEASGDDSSDGSGDDSGDNSSDGRSDNDDDRNGNDNGDNDDRHNGGRDGNGHGDNAGDRKNDERDNDDSYQTFLNDRALDGSGNNVDNPALGMAGTIYPRLADAAYADEESAMLSGPSPRYISNRIYNDNAENLFSENDVTHWGFVWGQFIDHTIGLRQVGDEAVMIPFDDTDPLEQFENDLGAISFSRSAAAPSADDGSPREQINTVSSYLDGFAVYGDSDERLDWLRVGPLDGDPANNSAELLNVDGYLPTVSARGDASTAPFTELFGAQRLDPTSAVVAGDSRVNENLGLTAVQTLFMREHNRIVGLLPETMPEEVKFAIARRVVGATQQYITYQEFLPAFGIELAHYDGYDPTVDAGVTNEFATVGYRAHSMIHGEFEMGAALADYTAEELAALEEEGLEIEIDGDEVEFAIPLNIAFGNPQLLQQIGLDAALVGFASEAQYANDETIDNQLRSVLFQIPSPGAADPAACLDGVDLPDCYNLVNDLGVLDLMRAYDHGIPLYNELRVAYGLPPVSSFTEITGEATEEFPVDPEIDAADPINDPSILDVMAFYDGDGNLLTQEEVDAGALPVTMERRTTLAARLKAIYGTVDALDPFTGMMAELHIPGTEFGELQLAMWETQFAALRDGDRYFYKNDSVLKKIKRKYEIDYRQTLAEVIVNNGDLSTEEVPANVFVVE